jgi:hypothetical protein
VIFRFSFFAGPARRRCYDPDYNEFTYWREEFLPLPLDEEEEGDVLDPEEEEDTLDQAEEEAHDPNEADPNHIEETNTDYQDGIILS